MSRIVCDPKLCSGCLACVVACLEQHYDIDQENAISPRLYARQASPKTGMVCYHTRSCMHCKDAPCVNACKARALYTDESGLVIPVRDKCVGCSTCAKACPHDVPQFDSEGKLVKCDGCVQRIAQGLPPACVKTCATGALRVEE